MNAEDRSTTTKASFASLSSQLLEEMKEQAYRSGLVAAQIEIDLPLQIRALRKQRGWKQPELAARTGMKQPRISAMEKPGGSHFTIETLRRLADAFDVALVVRFAAFSELVDWSEGFDPDNFAVPTFDQEINELDMQQCERGSVQSAKNSAGDAGISGGQFSNGCVGVAQQSLAAYPTIQDWITNLPKAQLDINLNKVNAFVTGAYPIGPLQQGPFLVPRRNQLESENTGIREDLYDTKRKRA
jgi:transcriptional regulator with XRE-family HTH domain